MDDLVLYHESQASALCGVHALNALVQGRVFSEIDLANIAHQLDEEEREMMARGGVDSRDYLAYLAADSSHVSDDGNYSVEVLRRALASLSLELIPLVHPDVASSRADPTQEDGFLMNNSSHWFALRRIAGTWYNLNSLQDGPEVVGDLYLATFIETMIQQGWTALIVRGTFPMPEQFSEGFVYDPEVWKHPVDVRNNKRARPERTDPDQVLMDELEAAIAASLSEPPPAARPAPVNVVYISDESEDDTDLRNAIQRSLES
eukprot:Amastigsp_a509787_137.p1 type:complete len:261 gc:universal Amastigsp_a509787_137:73-855(+)